MKLKKRAKKILIILLLILLVVLVILAVKSFGTKEVKETKVLSEIKGYGYKLKDNKTAKYKKMFEELKEILNTEPIDEEKYAEKIAEMFIYDFYSLNDKTAKTDIGGVEFVYPAILENFLQNAQDTYYKYIESNVYDNRKQSLPVVTDIKINSIEKQPFAYNDSTDENAYTISVSWDYTDSQFSNYQKEAKLIFVHDNEKLYLVELQ